MRTILIMIVMHFLFFNNIFFPHLISSHLISYLISCYLISSHLRRLNSNPGLGMVSPFKHVSLSFILHARWLIRHIYSLSLSLSLRLSLSLPLTLTLSLPLPLSLSMSHFLLGIVLWYRRLQTDACSCHSKGSCQHS